MSNSCVFRCLSLWVLVSKMWRVLWKLSKETARRERRSPGTRSSVKTGPATRESSLCAMNFSTSMTFLHLTVNFGIKQSSEIENYILVYSCLLYFREIIFLMFSLLYSQLEKVQLKASWVLNTRLHNFSISTLHRIFKFLNRTNKGLGPYFTNTSICKVIHSLILWVFDTGRGDTTLYTSWAHESTTPMPRTQALSYPDCCSQQI